MKKLRILIYLLIFIAFSCQKKKIKVHELETEKEIKSHSSKKYQRIGIHLKQSNNIEKRIEAFVSKEKDTFWNTWKYYENGIIDTAKSSFFSFKIEGLKTDSILKGEIKIFSPADTIPKSSLENREVTLLFLQKENDSLYIKEVKTNKNRIMFEYKNFNKYNFEGHVTDLRFFKIDSLPDELLLKRSVFTVDTKDWTDNIFVEFLRD